MIFSFSIKATLGSWSNSHEDISRIAAAYEALTSAAPDPLEPAAYQDDLLLSTLAATIASVGTVYAALFRQDIASFLPTFAVGLIVWTLIATTLQEGSNIFVASNHLIKAVPAPLIVHVLQMMARNVLIFAHHLVIVVLLNLTAITIRNRLRKRLQVSAV